LASIHRWILGALCLGLGGLPGCGEDLEIESEPEKTVVACSSCCGNGHVGRDEECDDGNLDPRDACLTICVVATCGDGVVWRNVEECDDGNREDGDSCSNDCKGQVKGCGDGLVEGDEECEDPEHRTGASCNEECRWNECGDGYVYGKKTDPENENELEACDDGNRRDDDGCDSDCELETTPPP